MKRIALVLALIVAGTTVPRLTAAPILYTDRAAFTAAAPLLQIIDFEGLAPVGDLVSYVTGAGLTLKGVNFVGPYDADYYLFVIDPAFSPDLYDWGSGAALLGPSTSFASDSRIEVYLPPGVTAVGTDIMTVWEPGSSLSVRLATSESVTVGTNGFADRAFVGFISDVPITSLTFVAQQDAYPYLDNFTFNSAPHPTPEPASILLLALGMATIGGHGLFWRGRPHSWH